MQCTDCVTDCTEPICPPVELTAQCTDQCVVISCADPDHDSPEQHRGDQYHHCDLVCDGTTNCPNCTGFDEFLECCAGYHPPVSDPRPWPTESTSQPLWDPSLEAYLCACDEQRRDAVRADPLLSPQYPVDQTYPPPRPPPHSTPQSPPAQPLSFDMNHHPTPKNPTFMNHQQYPPHTISSREVNQPSTLHNGNTNKPSQANDMTLPDGLLVCMWDNCQAAFGSLDDLAHHVNLHHLRVQTPPPSSTTASTSQASRISCLWRDCNLSPQSPPTNGESKEMLNTLTNHLFHDHLGFSSESLLASQTCDYPKSEVEEHLSSISTPSEWSIHTNSPLPSSQDSNMSTDTHQCHWRSCGQTFQTCDELTAHLTAVHVGAGKAHYECYWGKCNRHGDHGFTSKQKICRHLQSHTGHRPFQCKICLQNFSEAATLQQHMRRHTQEKPYKCDYPGCGKSFAITGALTIHKRTHNGHKPFKCTYCDRGFAESSNLSKHLRTHTGARPYSCAEPGCTKCFARPDQLTRHMSVHRKKNMI
ncbi:hypothetical protein BD779DRAFT_1610244 [Infundibulicybe gibba]|nr:hypothetical protein BD779DRAFT_1610244 [Infundibulicybe gibba]